MLFCLWLLSLHITFMWSIHGVKHSCSSYTLNDVQYFILWAYYSLFIHSVVHGHEGGFSIGAMMSSTVMNITAHVFWWTQISALQLGIYLEVEFLGCIVSVSSIIVNTHSFQSRLPKPNFCIHSFIHSLILKHVLRCSGCH